MTVRCLAFSTMLSLGILTSVTALAQEPAPPAPIAPSAPTAQPVPPVPPPPLYGYAPPPYGYAPPPYGYAPPVGVPISLTANSPQAVLLQQDPQRVAIWVGGRTGVMESWRQVCHAPCQASVDPYATYKVGGDGLTESRSFTLPAGGPISLKARTGSRGASIGGVLSIGLGGIMIFGGVALMGLGMTQKNFGGTESFFADTRARGDTLLKAGGVVMALSPIPIIAGVVTILRNRTLVRIEGGRHRAPQFSPTPGGLAF